MHVLFVVQKYSALDCWAKVVFKILFFWVYQFANLTIYGFLVRPIRQNDARTYQPTGVVASGQEHSIDIDQPIDAQPPAINSDRTGSIDNASDGNSTKADPHENQKVQGGEGKHWKFQQISDFHSFFSFWLLLLY